MKGSDAALKYLVAAQNTRLKKVEGDTFLPIDARPNGRPSPPPSSEEREKTDSIPDTNFVNSTAVLPGREGGVRGNEANSNPRRTTTHGTISLREAPAEPGVSQFDYENLNEIVTPKDADGAAK